MYSRKAVEYSRIVSPWGKVPEILAQAQRCAARACELRPKLPYGFENAASIFQEFGMHESSYMYADKVYMEINWSKFLDGLPHDDCYCI